MTVGFSPPETARLRERLSGRLALPGEQAYDAARRVWNATHDYRPALVVQPRTTADVQAAVGFARDRELPVCVRGGGHDHAGYAVAHGALMLDLSAMATARVDPARRVAIVGGGATWGTVDEATQAAGLAVTGADVSAVGVGGATLGGGPGRLDRVLGLSCDNLLAAEIVTADAEVRWASADSHPELFWALRGGNFGAVTAFTFAVHPVGPVQLGTAICPIDRAADALGLYQQLCESGGDELFVRAGLITAPPARSSPSGCAPARWRSRPRPGSGHPPGPGPRWPSCAASHPPVPTWCGPCRTWSCSGWPTRWCPAECARSSSAASPARSAPG